MAIPKLNPTPSSVEDWISLGLYHYQQHNYGQALAAFDQAITMDPSNGRVWNYRANVLCGLNRQAEALATYDRAISLHPTYHQAWFNQGQLLKEIGAYGNALAAYDRAIAIHPDPQYLHARAGIWVERKLFAEEIR